MLEVPQHDSGTWSAASPYIPVSTRDLKETILNTQTEDERPFIILLNKIVGKDVSKEKNVGTWMDSLLLTTSVAFYYDFCWIGVVGRRQSQEKWADWYWNKRIDGKSSLASTGPSVHFLSLIMEINKANFNQVQGDEFDQIGKIFAVDLYKLFIIMKLWSCFFFDEL